MQFISVFALIIVPEIPKIIERSSITLPEGNKTVVAIKCLALKHGEEVTEPGVKS